MEVNDTYGLADDLAYETLSHTDRIGKVVRRYEFAAKRKLILDVRQKT